MKIKNKNQSNITILDSTIKIDLLEAISFMEKRVDEIIFNNEKELIWILEHNSVYTAGRGQVCKDLKINNTPVYNIGRGGKITWHGPGQKIIYFMVDLKIRNFDIRSFVHNLEQFIIDALLDLGIRAYRIPNLIGIWTKNKNGVGAKIASLGLRVRKGVVYHGLSINFDCDLSNFKYINPCGLTNANTTSIRELDKYITEKEFRIIIKKKILNFI